MTNCNKLFQIRQEHYQNSQVWQDEVLYCHEIQEILMFTIKNLPADLLLRDQVRRVLHSIFQPHDKLCSMKFSDKYEIIAHIEKLESDVDIGSFKVETAEELILVLKQDLTNIKMHEPMEKPLYKFQKKMKMLMKVQHKKMLLNM